MPGAFWFVAGFCYFGFLFGTARLCGLNSQREDERAGTPNG